ncbi:MAG: glycine/betaine/sarcosine/D-proline family reductase selenoprotein B [Nitrospinaceae bacterium]|jgi:glycine reductase complex component B subunit gamma|nr:glycine/betaine/sarcosine/D-proline family reductase selenoprotein B [Nitrospinaceae bacterium]MBT3435534.1 glycine/betaine/sarcosine/D-proline family reductase selenoprotein B [Nitrospinaceae bacterium]MBT3820319.1 glycine/betaine/sarcosine/D-proline family reductase selenoprotein B [Nitrospinaceae bacterium]MBT4094873.1 glycine/betaine/sarcosine/D-proline family reductase selenoprotein B [Nitrospinaceae bacterium]MBT5368313.1 glycine/betaine/sarcosine/D-proline family reductase selenoprote
MSGKLRVVHYLNQFFAGVGGEEKSDHPVSAQAGPVGPGLLLNKILGADAEVVGTVFAGDGLFAENEEACAAEAISLIKEFSPDLILAGPAFNAGRFGLACAAVCRAALEAKISAITAMHPENPGFSAAGASVYTAPAAESAAGMEEALEAAVRIGLKLARGAVLGNAADEGYFPRGIRYNEFAELPTSRRAVDLLLKKIKGEPYETELEVPILDDVTPPEPIADLKKARIAIVSEGGMVPPGNPDRFAGARNDAWATYSFEGKDALPGGTFISIHGGFNTLFVNDEPDRMLAVDAFRQMEGAGEIGELHNDFLSTCGNGGAFADMDDIGRAWAAKLKTAGVEGAVLPAT